MSTIKTGTITPYARPYDWTKPKFRPLEEAMYIWSEQNIVQKQSTVAHKEIINFWKHNFFRKHNVKPICVTPVGFWSEKILATKID